MSSAAFRWHASVYLCDQRDSVMIKDSILRPGLQTLAFHCPTPSQFLSSPTGDVITLRRVLLLSHHPTILNLQKTWKTKLPVKSTLFGDR